MKLARFTREGQTRIGKVVGETVVDLSAVVGEGDAMRALIETLDDVRDQLEAVEGPAYALADVKLAAPINDAQKFLAIGMNYQAHAEESIRGGHPVPKHQLWFNKQVSCINGPYDDIVLYKVSEELDYEAELAYVIGKTCKNVKKADALDVIAGYMVCNDVTVRDWQHRTPTYTLGKSFDTHGPIGPWLTTADEIGDAENLDIKLTVDGVVRQHAKTNDLIYKIADQIEYLTTVMTLYPGDIIATGTPSGVAIVDRNWMRDGQVCRVEIEKLGAIENRIAAEV
ncbi:2-hydroxyhepta-24-diene-1 [Novosphingobium sp. Rr 2-17]|uniref:fumarylacetoacetate hydrolase family protein n=1 Tax=Novosphingobium sp. Rr 2-17 TaxID=555793 RepID=UPI0002697EA8|nr:fumarylacetoacetate hydrolase family protein [Novosphingobium sp. Rr 2-17]EIZ79513.1 2-hydroxyhepta-24-diene-1 [Novosphingobium sp. Rr 2-17]